jgi:hypothetical protein
MLSISASPRWIWYQLIAGMLWIIYPNFVSNYQLYQLVAAIDGIGLCHNMSLLFWNLYQLPEISNLIFSTTPREQYSAWAEPTPRFELPWTYAESQISSKTPSFLWVGYLPTIFVKEDLAIVGFYPHWPQSVLVPILSRKYVLRYVHRICHYHELVSLAKFEAWWVSPHVYFSPLSNGALQLPSS